MAAASLLEDRLRALHECLAADASQKGLCSGIITDIGQICNYESEEKDIDFCCSCLFNKDNGIVAFLQRAITHDELQGAKAQALDLLSIFVERVGKKVLPYAGETKDVCVSLFSRDRYAKVKNAALPLLSQIIQVSAGSSLGKDLQIDKLINKFFNELVRGKQTPTVREKIYTLLGVIAEIYPEEMTPYADRLTDIYVGALRAEINSKTRKPELAVISGCLEGLNGSLVNFTEAAEEGSGKAYEIFKYTRNAIDSSIEWSRYDVPRAGLRLIARHASQFSQFLVEDYESMYEKMSFWSHHKNSQLLQLGLMAIEAFLTQISELLVRKEEEGVQKIIIFKYFLCKFREIMQNDKVSDKELTLAIKGYGLLAAPCRALMSATDVKFMLNEIMTKTEQQYLGETDDIENRLHNLSGYLESLACIIRELDDMTETDAISLEHLLVLLMENIPRIHKTKHFLCVRAILWILLAVMPRGTAFRQILSGFVYQSLIRTCSHVPDVQTENEEDTLQVSFVEKKITYKDYMEVWTSLFDAAKFKVFTAANISLDTCHQLTDQLYAELLTAIMKIVNKLDLSSSTRTSGSEEEQASTSLDMEEGLTSADPLLGVQANKQKDHQVFINLVDFCRDLLPVKHYQKFECWVYTFSHRLIVLSTENPLVSGFYKLLSVNMKIANKLNYFQNVVVSKESSDEMETDADGYENTLQKTNCYHLVKKFSKEVLVRMKQYREDLLASCLTFILSLPKEIIAEQMSVVVPAIQIALNLGLSYLPLAEVALDALEYWSSTIPRHMMMPHYPAILPCLDIFLKTNGGADEASSESNINITKNKTGKGRKKLQVKLVRGLKDSGIKSFETQLARVKSRIIQYLGGLGGDTNPALLAMSDEEISQKAISWDTVQHLKFAMPFVDMKPIIYLDPFLPKVAELAKTSSDRQTKVAACELLHSLVLYCLGQASKQTKMAEDRYPMSSLYQHIFPTVLKLSCDVEQVARQLFEPLTMQLIHWFTSNRKSENPETIALLDAIYEGMIQQSDTGLRDFCARCLNEFLKWSIKQIKPKKGDTDTNPANAKSVLRRLYSYALHPSAFKRLGAALAFNNIYTVFREDDSLVDIFTFELLVHFVESLAIAHGDEKSLGTQEQCCKALEHLERIIRQKVAILKKASKQRKQPKEWHSITLDIAVRWLVRQCGRQQTECRHACMKLSYKLCPLISGIDSAAKFFQLCLKGKGPGYFITRFEGGGQTSDKKLGIETNPSLVDVADIFSLQTTLSWFDMLLAALDCYSWVFGESLLTPAEVFAKKGESQVFAAVEYFLKNIARADIEDVAKLFPVQAEADVFTPREREEFNRDKCTVTVRLLNFLTVMMAKFKKETLAVVPKSVWGGELWDLMYSCVVQPSIVGFNMGDVEVMKNLPDEMEVALIVLCKSFKDEIQKKLTKVLTGDKNLFPRLPLSLEDPGHDLISLQQMLSGYGQLHKVGQLLPCLPSTARNKMCTSLFDNVYQGIVTRSSSGLKMLTLTPMIRSLCKAMLDLSFLIGLPVKYFLNCILSQTTVGSSSQVGGEQCHGDLFFSLFKPSIAGFCVSNIAEVLPLLLAKASTEPSRVGTVLTATIDHVSRDRECRKRDGSKVQGLVLSHWGRLACWWGNEASADLQGMALLLLTKLLLIDSKFVSTPDNKSFEAVFSMYQSLLTDTRTTLIFKCRVLELLPFFATVPEPYTARLKSSLDRIVADKFPLRSSEFPKGTPKHHAYITAIDRILSGLQMSGSLMLLEFLISIFCREKKHVHEDEIQAAITKFTRRLPRDKQKSACDVPYKIFTKVGSFPAEIRQATLERVCLPILRLVSKAAAIEFLVDHIQEMKALTETKFTKLPSSETLFEGQLVTRIGSFQLLEMMYSRLDKEEVVGMSSAINTKFCDGKVSTGKELTTFVSKTAHDAKGEDIRGEVALLELRRQYHCAAYNLMVAFICCTQTEQKYFTAFLFEEKEAKGQFLLENLVDKEKVYEFPVELMSPLERKKKFVSIHQEVKERRAEDEEGDEGSDDYAVSYHMASQYLADSSLSEDVSQYSLSMSASSGVSSEDVSQYSLSMSASSGTLTGSLGRKRSSVKQSYMSADENEVKVEEDYVELEMDELNQHECMATMIAVLKHMSRNKITPEVPPATANPDMPSWMQKLHAKMSSAKTHFNIKLFVARLIINTAEIFKPYASSWIRLLCQLIITGPLSNGGISYLVVDVIVTMLSWHKTAIPQDNAEEKAMASRLVHFVIANVYNDTRAVFRNNIEMLKTLLDCWKPRLEIPYQVIYSQFHKTDAGKDNVVKAGIQVLGVVIACKFPPYGPVAPVDRDRFFIVLSNHMGADHKTMYAPTAEVCGMIFQYLSEKEGETEGTFLDHVVSLMVSLQQKKTDNFITCVHRMQKHYPPIADRFVNNLLFMLPRLQGEFRSLCLEIILGRADMIENIFVEINSKGLDKCLSHRDEETQQVSLKIVKAMLAKLKTSELTSLMSDVTSFISHPSNSCRHTMYEILMWVYDNYRDEETAESHKIVLQTKETLLRGLGDDDLVNRLLVQNFWSSETRLPGGTLDRLVAMLEAMYSPVTEQQYLSYATNLLLEMTSKSPDYQLEIFDVPLSECKFSDYAVKSSWRQRHAVMTPLFATMASQTQGMDADDSMDGPQIRATQGAQQFTQTVDPGASAGPFNWLTQSSLDTFSESSFMPTEMSASSSSLLFNVGAGDTHGNSRRRGKPGPGFGKQKMSASTSAAASSAKKEEPESGSELLRLKRRFMKDQTGSRNVYFAKRQIRLKEMRETAVKEQRSRRENQVTMYRKYRTGDLPDIQIKYSYLIAPLQALAQRDSSVGKLLFSCIFQAIFAEMDKVKTEREMTVTISQINKSLEHILSESTQYFPPFIGCLLDILYSQRSQLKVDVGSVGACSVFSKLQPLGIVVLEEQLIQDEPADARAVKRGKMETKVSTDVSHWIELSRLYKSVEEYDVLLGIFTEKIGTKPITQQAVEAEARGDYYQAKKLYDEALQCDDWKDGRPPDPEIDLWDDCRMECLCNLSQWKELETVCTVFDPDSDSVDLTKVWEDTYYQEHYLPYILRSKVKLLLEGDEEQQSLLDFVDSAMKVPEQKLVLENRYGEELALMYLWQEDYDRARHYTKMALEMFQQEWSSTDTLMLSSRTSALQKLQPLIELKEFLDFMRDENNFSSVGPAHSLMRKWNKRSPHLLLDPVDVWDDVVTNRYVYLDHISSRLRQADNPSQDSMETDQDSGSVFENTKIKLKLNMAKSCREKNNFTLTLRILKETYSTCSGVGAGLLCAWTHLYASTHQKKAGQTEWGEDTFKSLLTTIDQLGKLIDDPVLQTQSGIARQHHVLYGRGYELLSLGVNTFDRLRDMQGSKTAQKLMECGKVKKLDRQELCEHLVELGYKKMKMAIGIEGQGHLDEQTTQGMREDEAFLSAAKYCDSFLRLKEDGEIDLNDSIVKAFPDTVVMCMLKAMKYDSMEARQRFPRLLQLVERYPDTISTFISKSSEVPTWMFILWISQMLAVLDKPIAVAVHHILTDITNLYPQAVVYSFKLSKEGYIFGKSAEDKRNEAAVQKLSRMLSPDKVPLTDRLMSALDQLKQPDQEVKDWSTDFRKLLIRSATQRDQTRIREEYMKMYHNLLVYKPPRQTQSTQSESVDMDTVESGNYKRQFSDKFKAEFDKEFGKEGKKILTMDVKSFHAACNKLYNSFGMFETSKKLADYSPWLARFKPNTHSRNLEIPGQYTGLSKPLPEYHVKVAGFDQTVKVMTSLRKPKRLTFRGNDEKDYQFLVKGGEDLRQDQRIEQLFFIMNQVLNKDPVCRSRKLQLKTYQVIPMTTRLGLIEWVSNTKALKDFLLSAFTESESKAYGKQNPLNFHDAWIKKLTTKDKHRMSGLVYANVYKKYSTSETERQFNMVESKVPWNLSRRAFQSMSTSPEAFHMLRCKCIQTHAVISICHYILGIGDRHQSNFMINTSTGEMVGIDFGHAFGSATQFLPVPELMPFRLTRQIRNLMLPMQVKGLIDNTMIHVLRALRSDCDLLLSTMDIFVHEPSLDWLQNAEKQMKTLSDEDLTQLTQDGDEKSEWYPREKVMYVKRKLKGANPAYITRDELKLGHGKNETFKYFELVALGASGSVREKLPADGLTAEQQVAALIDQATDPNILGRTYVGWESWM